MQQREVEIINKLGLHARASAKLTQLAARYQSDVQMSRNGRKVNAKSIMGVMMLAAGKGAKVTIEIDGPDENGRDGCDRRVDRRLFRRGTVSALHRIRYNCLPHQRACATEKSLPVRSGITADTKELRNHRVKPPTNRYSPVAVRRDFSYSPNAGGVPCRLANVAITNPLGLHARACARIVQIASRFRSNVSLVVKGRRASARNIVAVMLLTASVGTTVRLEIDGPDEVGGDARDRGALPRRFRRALVAPYP